MREIIIPEYFNSSYAEVNGPPTLPALVPLADPNFAKVQKQTARRSSDHFLSSEKSWMGLAMREIIIPEYFNSSYAEVNGPPTLPALVPSADPNFAKVQKQREILSSWDFLSSEKRWI